MSDDGEICIEGQVARRSALVWGENTSGEMTFRWATCPVTAPRGHRNHDGCNRQFLGGINEDRIDFGNNT